jgi:hypothetical protein
MGNRFPEEQVTHPSRHPSKRQIHQENTMKRIKSILCSSLVTLALSSTALAGDIHGVAAPAGGDIHGIYSALVNIVLMVV